MRTVTFSVTTNGAIEPSHFTIGHAGEHNATTLSIALPESLCAMTDYFRLAIGSYQTEPLYTTDNTLSYIVPQCVLISGTQFLQLEGYKHSAEGELLLVFKSDIALAEVLPSIDPYNETTGEVRNDIDGALGKLHYYVTKSDELATEIKENTEECESILEEAKQTVYGKADIAHTLAGYGITDAYTSYETEEKISIMAGALMNEINSTYSKKSNILDYITYKTSNGEVTITGCDKNISGAHIIPDTINGYPVTSIESIPSTESKGFKGCTKLTSITIPDSVTSIGYGAFSGCTALKSVTIGDGVKEIEPQIFSGCTALESVSLGDRITVISDNMFLQCKSLTSLTVPNGVTYIGSAAFSECTSLKSIIIPESVTTIGGGAFYVCTALTDIYFGGTKEQWSNITIGEYNESLTGATIHYKYDDVPTPIESNDAANKEYVDSLKHQKVLITDGDIITLADNTTYYAEGEISTLTVVYPDTDFICSLEFTLASEGDITITLPESKYIGGAPTFANGEMWELNIKNGVVVGGLVE